MAKTELKPTTREERERWKLHCSIYQDRPYTPGREEFIARLIADVERLEGERDYWKSFHTDTVCTNYPPPLFDKDIHDANQD